MRSHPAESLTGKVQMRLTAVPPHPLPPQDFHESLHSLLLWLAHADSRRYAVDATHPDTPVEALQQHRSTLTVGGYYHPFEASSRFAFFAGWHRRHFSDSCRICGRSCSAGWAARLPFTPCGRSSRSGRRPRTAARPRRSCT